MEANIELSKRKKRGIKKSKNYNLKLIKNDFIDLFWNEILSANLEKKYKVKPVHTINEIRYLQSKFPENIVFYGVLFEEELIAGSLLFVNNDVIHAQYIAANEVGKKLFALDFLFSELLKNEMSRFRYFSLGISNENDGRILNKGLFDWKQGFGSEIFQNKFYSINTNNYFLLENFL